MSLDVPLPINFWTEERVGDLRRLYAENKTFRVIASELGVTRNSVIGKAGRLGLADREGASIRAKRKTEEKPRAVGVGKAVGTTLSTFVKKVNHGRAVFKEAPPRPAVSQEPPPATRCSLLDLGPDSCRWPYGDVGTEGFAFCGAVQRPGSPYCLHHFALAYVPPRHRASPLAGGAQASGPFSSSSANATSPEPGAPDHIPNVPPTGAPTSIPNEAT